jgi:hypothetical protein
VGSDGPIILSDEIIPPPALVRAGLESLPAIIRTQGERASRRFIEFFTATIRNRNTRMAYARAVKRFFDWCDEHHLEVGRPIATFGSIPFHPFRFACSTARSRNGRKPVCPWKSKVPPDLAAPAPNAALTKIRI